MKSNLRIICCKSAGVVTALEWASKFSINDSRGTDNPSRKRSAKIEIMASNKPSLDHSAAGSTENKHNIDAEGLLQVN